MVSVFREVRRVLRDDGTLWLNLGDSYSGGGNYRGINSENTLAPKQASNRGDRGLSQQLGALGKETGVERKNLVGIPWRVAFALQADGWYLRQDIIWAKPNPMPESVRDRCTKSHEYLFLLAKSERYYYDADAIAEPQNYPERRYSPNAVNNKTAKLAEIGNRSTAALHDGREQYGNGETRNKRSVWTIATQPYSDAHFATFPPALIEPCILAGCPTGGVVLDPFGGSGTTGQVAENLGRNWVLIELNADYVQLCKRRTRQIGMAFT